MKQSIPSQKIRENNIPTQPGFEIKSYYDHYLKKRSDFNSGKYNLLYYQFKHDVDSTLVIPDGCVDILFRCNMKNPTAHFCGTVLEGKEIFLEPGEEYFGVRYFSDQVLEITKELVNKEIALADMIPSEAFIIEKISQSKSFQERVIFFEHWFNDFIISLRQVPELIQFSMKKIYSRKGIISIEELAEETGYSTRYLRKKFEEFVGISPKLFSQIVRFQNSVSMLLEDNTSDVLDVVAEYGYYDQSHFISQFRKFSNLTPTRFREIYTKKAFCIS